MAIGKKGEGREVALPFASRATDVAFFSEEQTSGRERESNKIVTQQLGSGRNSWCSICSIATTFPLIGAAPAVG